MIDTAAGGGQGRAGPGGRTGAAARPWTPRSSRCRRATPARPLQQQGDTLLLHYSSADPVVAGTVQGIFSAFVDQANIAVSGVPPTYTLQTEQVEDESLQPIQYIAPGMIGYGIAVGAVFGAALTLITWREKKLLRRLRLAPVSTSTVVGSRVSVSMAVAIGQLVLFVGISVLPFLGPAAQRRLVHGRAAGDRGHPGVPGDRPAGRVGGQDRGGRQRAGEPDHPADGVPVRRLHPAGGGARVAGDASPSSCRWATWSRA